MNNLPIFSFALAGYRRLVNDKFQNTLLNLFSIAYRSRCSLPLILSAACLIAGCKFRVDFTFQFDEDEEEEDVSEDISDDESEQECESVTGVSSQERMALIRAVRAERAISQVRAERAVSQAIAERLNSQATAC